MENAALQDFIDQGFKQIGETEGDGRGNQVYLTKKQGKDWMYTIVNLTDDGYVRNAFGLARGKLFVE